MNKLNFDDCLDELKNLVNRFDENIDDYKSSRYDEENTKIDFIDKFFALLGWDVYNDQGFSEDLREVIREDKLVYRGMTISPDYVFRTGKERQFFVEAKKPLVNIKEGIEPAFQVRRYAYTAGLPVSILTDFEEFAVYDTRIKPNHKDKAGTARIFYCNYLEYEKNLEFLFNTFSKTAIWQGKLKRYTEDNKKKKGTQTVDKAMLVTIDGWRNELAKNIALRNKHIDIYQLNEAVQKIIDRIIFLRIAEDRNTEIERSLEIIAEKPEIYNNLVKYFTASNNKYNSGLFRIVDWIDRLVVDDKTFKDIIKDLYFPSPYEFSVLPIEILGQIYEQFLGKTIRLTQGHQAKVEEKPEVRKAGGVYYTPKYIVNYIVENTVGKLLNSPLKKGARGLSPDEASNIKVLDPACGSGSFLVGAFNYLLNYHLEYYTDEKRKAKALKEGAIYQVDENTFRLTIREKRKILLNNIYGVDIDPQAVEVTKLSLLLKLMEGEIVESRGELFLKSVSEALLPDLKDNIKCGNSLIGTDFYHEKDMQLFDTHEQRKINCFDWEVEFPQVFGDRVSGLGDQGLVDSKTQIPKPKTPDKGFDCVIGNPPYVLFESKDEKNYLSKKYNTVIGKPDLFKFFIVQGLNLTRALGYFSYIIPSSLLTIPSAKYIRKNLLNKDGLIKLVIFSGEVFENVSVNSLILFANPNSDLNKIEIIRDKEIKPNIDSLKKALKQNFFVNKLYWKNEEDYCFYLVENKISKSLLDKIERNSVHLSEICKYTLGMQVYHNSMHFQKDIKNRIYHNKIKIDDTYYHESGGRNIQRYYFKEDFKEFVSYGKWCYNKPDIEFCTHSRILIREIPSNNTLICTYTDSTHVSNKAIIILLTKGIDLKYILGIINSKLIGYYIRNKGHKSEQRLFPRISLTNVRNLPLVNVKKSNKAQHDRMINLVEQMLEAQKQIHSDKSKTETDKKLLQQRIDIIDKQIDRLVYELYGLTEEEIRIIEEV